MLGTVAGESVCKLDRATAVIVNEDFGSFHAGLFALHEEDLHVLDGGFASHEVS